MHPQEASKRWFERHPRLTVLAVALVGCCLAVVLAEVSARVLLPRWAPTRQERANFWVYSDLLGWEHRPGQRGRFNHRDFAVGVAINSAGLRDDEYPVERTDKKRMLILGDSFGWGFGVEHNERFSEILENEHVDWEIINASVSGYSTDQQYLYLKEEGLTFKPDVVLLLFYENDFEGNARPENFWYNKPFFSERSGRLELNNVPVPDASTRQLVDRFFLGRTFLGPRIYFVLNRLRSMIQGMDEATTDGDVAGTEVMYGVTERLIAAMDESTRTAGALFVVVSIPMEIEKRTELQRIAHGRGIPYLPLDAHFESNAQPVTFTHDAHWNAYGHAIAAQAIDTFLIERGIFGRPP